MGKKRQIVVVGAGVLGASVALHLAWAGAAVTLVEASEPGQGTSAVSFAWLNAFGKRPFLGPTDHSLWPFPESIAWHQQSRFRNR